MDLYFKILFAAIMGGPTSCGKSYFVTILLKHLNLMCYVQFYCILKFYDKWQPLYQNNNKTNSIKVKFH